MRWRNNLISSVLVAVFVALPPLAYASPPDPTYIGGFWDDDDYDDVVILATSSSSIIDVQAPYDLSPVRVVLPLPAADDPLIWSRPLGFCAPRAPPNPT